MAEAHYAQFAPHLFAGPIEAAANIQLSACSPNFLILESIDTFPEFFSGLLDKPIQWEEGYVVVPDRPGLGFELNEAHCDANPYTSDEVFPPMATLPI
ncbi:MAG: enolase C-terminal domain-like protein, partial [Halieaceae bacterium]|nr:enolase C-terminal domain-like protein [Halieaceae bacterium]